MTGTQKQIEGSREGGHPVTRWRLTAVLEPGGSATAIRVHWQGDHWENTQLTGVIYDNYDLYPEGTAGLGFGQNYGLIGEIFKTRLNPEAKQHQCIGSQGLHRVGTADNGISNGQTGVVSILESSTPSCNGSDSDADITACAKMGDVSADDVVFVDYHPELRRWFVTGNATKSTHGSQTIRFKAVSFLQPGNGQNAEHYIWNGGAWVDSTNKQWVYDDSNHCCMLDNEENLATNVHNDRWQVHSMGLERWAVVDEAAGIDVNGSGTVNMIDFTNGQCAGTEKTSNHHVEVCNGSAATKGIRKVFDDEAVKVRYENTVWHIVEVPRRRIIGTPQSALLASGFADVFDVYKISGGGVAFWATNTVDNVLNRSGIVFARGKVYSINWFGEGNQPVAFPENIKSCVQ